MHFSQSNSFQPCPSTAVAANTTKQKVIRSFIILLLGNSGNCGASRLAGIYTYLGSPATSSCVCQPIQMKMADLRVFLHEGIHDCYHSSCYSYESTNRNPISCCSSKAKNLILFLLVIASQYRAAEGSQLLFNSKDTKHIYKDSIFCHYHFSWLDKYECRNVICIVDSIKH